MPFKHETLRPFEFETDDPPDKTSKAYNDAIMDIEQCIEEMHSRELHNNSHMSSIRERQRMIKDMRCLP